MDTTVRGVSSCRHCQFYKVEGRRGGFCHQLGVPVQGRWRSCSFASPLFAASIAAQLVEQFAEQLAEQLAESSVAAETPTMVSLQKALELEALPAEPSLPLEVSLEASADSKSIG